MRISIWFLFFLVQFIISSDCRGQTIEYEELSRIPLTDVDYVTVAPYGSIFMTSQGDLYRSDDDGLSWSKLQGFPQGFDLKEIDFFSDGTAVFTNRLIVSNELQFLVFRDNELKELIPNNLGDGKLNIIGNTVYYFRSDSVFVSIDKGSSFDSYEYQNNSDVVVDLHFYDARLFLYTYDIDTLSQDRLYAIKEYDLNFNLVESRLLPQDPMLLNSNMFASGRYMVFQKKYNNPNTVWLTTDGGQSFTRKEINSSSSFRVGIYKDTYFYNTYDSIYALKLSDDFLTNSPISIGVKNEFESVAMNGKNLIYKGDNYFRVENIDDGNEIYVYEFPFKNSQISKLRIDKDDNIFASSKSRTKPASFNYPGCFIFKSTDDGKSWEQFYGTYFSQLYSWSLADDGGLTIGHKENYSPFESAIYLSPDGAIGNLYDSLYRPEVHSLNNGDYRIIIAGSDGCYDVVPGVAISAFNEDYKFVSFSPWDCLPINMQVVIYNNKIYFFGGIPTDLGIYYSTSFPTQQFSNMMNEVEIPSSFTFGSGYYSDINSEGEIYVYPTNKSLFSNTIYDRNYGDAYYPVYYSPDIESEDIKEIGQAPLGQLVRTDNNDRAFILQSDGTHYVRSDYAIGYDKVEVINKSFETFIDGDFDSQNRLVIAVEDGRVLRAVTDGITTSTSEVENVDFTLSPNPASEILHVSMDDAKKSTIKISNIAGRIVSISQHDEVNVKIDISGLTKGIYFLSIHDESGSKGTRKFVKM